MVTFSRQSKIYKETCGSFSKAATGLNSATVVFFKSTDWTCSYRPQHVLGMDPEMPGLASNEDTSDSDSDGNDGYLP